MNNRFDPIHVERVQVQDATIEDYVSKGMELREQTDNTQWAWGDLASDVTYEFGSKFVKEYAKMVGMPVATLRRYRDVARAWEPDVREEFKIVPWSIFRELAAKENRLDILRRCADEQWSFEKLKEIMKPTAIDDDKFIPPKPELKLCATCRKWKIADSEFICKDETHIETVKPTGRKKS